jgi:hypothetical protein
MNALGAPGCDVRGGRLGARAVDGSSQTPHAGRCCLAVGSTVTLTASGSWPEPDRVRFVAGMYTPLSRM